jgi:diguanylate cyclase (GGDEF)-like protein/PAS domain S-box-containing protein
MDQRRSGVRSGSRKGTRGDSEGLWDWNLESDRIHFSPRWIALVGCEDHEVGSKPEDWFQRVHPDDSPQLLRQIEVARTGDSTSFTFQYRLRHKDGTYRWMICRGVVVRDKAGQATRLTGSHSDVTVEMVTDPLTRLPNRLLLVDRVTHSIERARRYRAFHFALLLIDLGRPVSPGRRADKGVGDPLLTAVARRLETCLRIPETMPSLRHNDLVARVDGDHFAILLDGLKEITHAKVVADRILGEILHPFALGGREVWLSASIGIAVSATGYTKAEDVLHDAETALHRVHVLGGSHCEVFDTAILKSEQRELQLEADFEGALPRGEFELFYQPIVSLTSNEVLGFEALVRWRHPVLGMIPPVDFIPIAERCGFIVPLGNWILREACLRLSAWKTALPLSRDVSMSVNLSSVQWNDAALVDQIGEALRDAGLESRRLVLELTEGVAMANPTAVTTLLMRLRAIGVRISVDDFGTGYSSLAYLRQFPIDTLKIDRYFIRGMVTNKDTAEIVASVIAMSQQLGLHVVAEGIEHEDQLARLRALNCEAGQGNLFAKPLDVDEAAELLKTGLAPRPERRRNATAPLRREPPVPLSWVRGKLPVVNSVSLAVSALVLIGAGLVGVISVRSALGSSPTSANTVTQQPAVEASAAPPLSTSPVTVEHETPKGHNSALLSATPSSAAISPSLPLTAPRTVPATMSLNVVHLHRFGSCRGRLDVTRDGVSFVSDEDDDGALTLKYAEFLHALADDTLTLRSATRIYRFKVGASGDANKVQLRDVADRIARSRP